MVDDGGEGWVQRIGQSWLLWPPPGWVCRGNRGFWPNKRVSLAAHQTDEHSRNSRQFEEPDVPENDVVLQVGDQEFPADIKVCF